MFFQYSCPPLEVKYKDEGFHNETSTFCRVKNDFLFGAFALFLEVKGIYL